MRHGMSKSRQYVAYCGIRQRCENPNHKAYKWYGGRGIEFRLPSFEEFWRVMGPSWFKGALLDRIDNDGHYELGNVKWVTYKEQSRNKSNNVFIEFNGERMIAADWAERLGISRESLRDRLKRWPVEKALTTPGKPMRVTHNGKTQTVKEWAAEFDLHENTLMGRLKSGWSMERALHTEVKDAYRDRPRRTYRKKDHEQTDSNQQIHRASKDGVPQGRDDHGAE